MVPKLPLPGDRHTAGIQMVGRQTIVRAAKVGMVKGIEGIEPQLQFDSFGESHLLLEGEIHTEQSTGRSPCSVPAFPNVYCGCRAKACTLNHSVGSGIAELR